MTIVKEALSDEIATSKAMEIEDAIIDRDAPILVTGGTGFIGARVVDGLLRLGFRHLRCFARPSSDAAKVESMLRRNGSSARIEI